MSIAPQSHSFKERAYRYIVDCIQAGELTEGTRVIEKSIAEALHMSRTPVREALSEHAGDGYLEGVPQKGFRVRGFSADNAREVFEMIGPLDGRAAFLALPHMTSGDLAELHFLHESMELAVVGKLTQRYYDLQLEFHQLYINKCGNARLQRTLAELNQQISRRAYERDDLSALDNMRRANEEHEQIISLFEQGDGLALQDYIRDVHWSLDNVDFATWKA